jgi:hypothetical protein
LRQRLRRRLRDDPHTQSERAPANFGNNTVGLRTGTLSSGCGQSGNSARMRTSELAGRSGPRQWSRRSSAKFRSNLCPREENCIAVNAWFLGREPTSGNAFIIHQPNAPSGGRLSHIELGEFLRSDVRGPEHQALLRLIGTLVGVPPYA